MQINPTKARITAIVLAAGLSSRFGRSKMVAEFRGRPLLQHSLAAAADACPGQVCLVVGHNAENVVAAAAGLHDKTVVHGRYMQGMGSSISAGVRASEKDADAIILMLADQPLVMASHLRHLVRAWSGADTEIVASTFDDVRAPPILFPSSAFEALGKLSGDRGARDVVSSKAFSVRTVACPGARFDVDRPEDLHKG